MSESNISMGISIRAAFSSDQLPVRRMVSRIHHQKMKPEFHLPMAENLLHALCQQHGVLAAGNTDSNVVSSSIILYSFSASTKGAIFPLR